MSEKLMEEKGRGTVCSLDYSRDNDLRLRKTPKDHAMLDS